MRKNPSQHGFTLLEVLVALAIVGLAMGTTFALLSQSKRLAFKAADDMEHTIFIRAQMNLAQIVEKPEYPEQPEETAKQWELEADKLLDKVDRQSQLMRYALEQVTLKNSDTEQTFTSLRIKKLDSAR